MLLGYDIPKTEEEQANLFEHELDKSIKLRRDRKIMDLFNLPELTDATQLETLKLLMKLATTSYLTGNATLFQLTLIKMTNISLQFGNSEFSSFGYVNYGFIICAVLGKYKEGNDFGNLALSLAERYNNPSIHSRVIVSAVASIFHWRSHLRSGFKLSEKGFQLGLESGDFSNAGYNGLYIACNKIMAGAGLNEAYEDTKRLIEFFNSTHDFTTLDLYKAGVVQPILNLMGKTENKWSFNTQDFNEKEYITKYKDSTLLLAFFYYAKIRSVYLFEDYQQAKAIIEKLIIVTTALPGQYEIPEAILYVSLLITAIYPGLSKEEQKQYRQMLETHKKQMKEWADNCEDNFMHKYLLIEAEIARLSGKNQKAMKLYDEAIESARKFRFLNYEALGNEVAGRFYINNGSDRIARIFITEAHACYKAWGATAKAQDLEEKYSQLLIKQAPFRTGSTTGIRVMMDSNSVIKALQTISSEIMLDKLLDSLLRIVIENAGAQRGFFIMPKDDNELYIVAENEVASDNIMVSQFEPVIKSDKLSHAIIHYTARSFKNVLLNDAGNEGPYTNDPYILNSKPKSILCSPIIRHGRLIGILYLENNLVIGAFTAQRQEILRILAGQVAISLENAQPIALSRIDPYLLR